MILAYRGNDLLGGADSVSFILDHQLREQLHHISPEFPITFFHDEIADLPTREGPVHWHPEFEIVTAIMGVLDYQVGEEHILLNAGDSIFVNANMLHGIKQISGETADPMPGIVFLGTLIAPEGSVVYQKYIQKIAACDEIPYVVFRQGEHDEIHWTIQRIYQLLSGCLPLYELRIHHALLSVFDYLNCHFDEFPKAMISRVQMNAQIRVQQMLTYIYEHYADHISLSDIASAANISRSEAGRCFSIYLQKTPVDFLIQYRLQKAHVLLHDTTLTIQEISQSCGFHSTSYFTRQFRRHYGYTPGIARNSGK